jgi:TRAP-type C4-dicarboxylate transport system substrate-binding protein
LRAIGHAADPVKALGGTPRAIPMPELQDAIAKGVVNGMSGIFEVLKGWKLADVCKYATFAPGIGDTYAFYIAMNKNKWNNLPKDVQQVFNDVCKEYNPQFGTTWDTLSLEGVQYHLSLGNVFYVVPKDEMARWVPNITPLIDDYIKELAGKGYPEAQSKEMLEFLKGRISFWTQKYSELGLPDISKLAK